MRLFLASRADPEERESLEDRNLATTPESLRIFLTASILFLPRLADWELCLQDPRNTLIFCFGKVAVGLKVAFRESIRAMAVAVRSAVFGSKSRNKSKILGKIYATTMSTVR